MVFQANFTLSHSIEINEDPYLARQFETPVREEPPHNDFFRVADTHRAPSVTESDRSFGAVSQGAGKPHIRDTYKPVVAVVPVSTPPQQRAPAPIPPAEPVKVHEEKHYEEFHHEEPHKEEVREVIREAPKPAPIYEPPVIHSPASDIREVQIRTAYSPVEPIKSFEEDVKEKEDLSAAPGVRNLRSLFESGEAFTKRNFVVQKKVENPFEYNEEEEIHRVPTPESIRHEPVYHRDSVVSHASTVQSAQPPPVHQQHRDSVVSVASRNSTVSRPAHRDSVTSQVSHVSAVSKASTIKAPVPLERRTSNAESVRTVATVGNSC